MSKPSTSSPTKAVLYTRVSTGKQAASGLGLEAQLAYCRRVAELRGLEVVAVETDPALTGKDQVGNRPGLQRVLDIAAKSEDTVVVVYALSRLARRQALTWQLLDEHGEYRLKVISATETFDTSSSMGRAVIGMIGVWNQLEADMCSERTSAALQARSARGLLNGRRPIHISHPDLCRKVRQMYGTGAFSHVQLCEELNRLGVPTACGIGKWYPTITKKIVNGPEPVAPTEAAQ